MKRTILFCFTILLFNAFGAVLLLGCETKLPNKKSPESAFIRLARCIDTASTQCLFWEIDTQTRWSVSSVHKLLSQIRTQVEKSYPEDSTIRASAYGKWQKMAAAKTAEDMFHLMCEADDCLKNLAQGFGAVKKVTPNGDIAMVETVRGETFTMRKTKEKWGIVLFEKQLDGEKIRLSDLLKQVKRNAAEYEQQRLATGQ